MAQERAVNTISERDETLAHTYYSGGVLPILQVACFEYSAPRRTLLSRVSDCLGVRLNGPLSEAHRALLESDAEQTPEDLVLVDRMITVQRDALIP